jgi:hypothetical protein
MIIFVSRGQRNLRVLSGIAAIVFAAAIAVAATGNRHAQPNSQSPAADTSITLGGHAITIEYNAPSARGRKVEGGLIPYDSCYRLGADAATTLTTDADIMIGNLRVPKGVHTLFLQASATKPWELIVNKQTGQWGLEYHQDQDLGRVPLKLTKLDRFVEIFKITLNKTGESTGTLSIEWGNTKAEAPVRLA